MLACVVFLYKFIDYFGCMRGLETCGGSLLDWRCARSRCVDIGDYVWFYLPIFGSVDRFRDVLIQQLAWNLGAIYI